VRILSGRMVLPLLVFGFLGSARVTSAAETPAAAPTINLSIEPARYANVLGDNDKFRQVNWFSDGSTGGVEDFSLEEKMPDDVTLSMEGRAIFDEHDYRAKLSLTKEEVGFINFDFDQFRKYYDNTGGFFRRFQTIKSATLSRELAMDIGNFSVDAGLRMDKLPDVDLIYEREYRQGTKSRLSWTSVTDTGDLGSVARKIGPSWQANDEIVDSFEVKAEDQIRGFEWHTSQLWEYSREKSMREEQQLATTGTASDLKIRDQYLEPRSDVITTVIGASKWFMKEKVFVGSNYRFSQIDSRELENIFEYNANGVLTNFSNAESVRDAHSDNHYVMNTWVQSLMTTLWEPFILSTKFKVESANRHSESAHPLDNLPNSAGGSVPNGTIDQIDVSENQAKIERYGESFSIRYNGIARVALYNEYEFQQERNNLYEDRQSISAGEVFNRQSIAHMHRGNGTLGAQIVPWDPFTVTAQFRLGEDEIHYDNVRYTDNSTSGAKSVFVDGQIIDNEEFSTKITYRPCPWFQPSFRYKLQNRHYDTWGLSDDAQEVGTKMDTSIYTWDAVIQPMTDLLFTVSFSIQDAFVLTPAQDSPTPAQTPRFNSNVTNWLVGAEYALKEDVVLTGAVQYTNAANFTDFSNFGLPLGADFRESEITVGLRWEPKKDITLEPKYSFYHYETNPDAAVGNYNANVLWLEAKAKWG
jgi:hypothetical protein